MLTRKHGRLEWWGYHSLTWHSLGEISHGFCVPKGSHFWVEQPISVNISSILSSPQVGLGRPCEISQDDWNFNFLREGLGKIRLQTPRNTKITDLSYSGHWIPTIRGFPGREKASFSGSKKNKTSTRFFSGSSLVESILPRTCSVPAPFVRSRPDTLVAHLYLLVEGEISERWIYTPYTPNTDQLASI